MKIKKQNIFEKFYLVDEFDLNKFKTSIFSGKIFIPQGFSSLLSLIIAVENYFLNYFNVSINEFVKDNSVIFKEEEIMKFQKLIKQSKPCDIIISTYVSPWAGLYDQLYQELLTNLMSETSFLLSVDPQSSEKSVRLPLTGPINNQILYGSILSLILAKPPVTKENLAVEWTVWKRRKSTMGAN